MDRRSTNAKGFVHFGGDIQSGAEDGIGVRLGTASTGSTVWISAISDDTNAHIGIRAQGEGGVTINAGSAFKGAYSTTFTWAVAGIASNAITQEITLASTTCDIMPGDLIGWIGLNPTASTCDDLYIADIRQSTVGTSRVTLVIGNGASTTTSTQSGTGRITWIDLT